MYGIYLLKNVSLTNSCVQLRLLSEWAAGLATNGWHIMAQDGSCATSRGCRTTPIHSGQLSMIVEIMDYYEILINIMDLNQRLGH